MFYLFLSLLWWMSRYSALNIGCCKICYNYNLMSHFLSHRPGFRRVVWRGVGGKFQRCPGAWQQQSEEQRISATGERHQETQVLLHSCCTYVCSCIMLLSRNYLKPPSETMLGGFKTLMHEGWMLYCNHAAKWSFLCFIDIYSNKCLSKKKMSHPSEL